MIMSEDIDHSYKCYVVLFFAESGSRKLKDEPLFMSLPGQPLGNPLLCHY